MENETGKIVRIANGKAVIELEPGEQCETCGAKGACSAFGGNTTRHIEVPVTQQLKHIKEGDRITLLFQPRTRILSAFLVFILPIIFLVTGYFFGFQYFNSEGKAILISFVALLLSFIFLWILNKLLVKKEKFIPTILRIENT